MSQNNTNSNKSGQVFKIVGIIALVIVVLLIGILATTLLRGGAQLFGSTIGQSTNRYFNQEEVRKQCATKRNTLDTTYRTAQNQYSNASSIITDQVSVANLSVEAKKEINESALNLIFKEGPSQKSDIDTLFNTAAKYNIEFDKTDDQLYRNIQESIKTQRLEFRDRIDSFEDQKRSFKDYLIQESSKLRVGANEYEFVQALDSNDCLPGAYQIQKENPNMDILSVADSVLDKKYVLPKTFATSQAFSTGEDKGFVNP